MKIKKRLTAMGLIFNLIVLIFGGGGAEPDNGNCCQNRAYAYLGG